MAKVTLTIPNFDRFRQRIQQITPDLLELIGEVVLGYVRQDFADKSQGATDTDGTAWRPTTESGIRARAKRKPEWKASMQAWKAASQSEQAILDQYRQDGKFPTVASVGSRKRQKQIVGGILAGDDEYQAVRREMRQLKDEREAIVARADNGKTGVDTGELQSALRRGDENNVFLVDDDSVTVGVNNEHAAYFDRSRPLLPDDLPDQWRSDIEAQLQVRLLDELNDLLR